METRSDSVIPARAIHPGEILREELKERTIKQKDFALMIEMQASHLNAFINGKRNLNEDMAIKLERALGIPYKVWMDLQSGYLYDVKRIKLHKNDVSEICSNIDDAESLIIAQTLKSERKKAGLTQEELADKIGTKKTYISKLENGRIDIQLSTLFKIFECLGKRVRLTIL